jgi:hypothetical protein
MSAMSAMSAVPQPTTTQPTTTEPTARPASTSGSAPSPFQRAYLVACCAIIGGSLAYWLAHWAELPVLLYVPLQRRWTFEPPLTTPAITYFGLLLWGGAGTLCGALAGAGIDAAANAALRRPLSASALRLFGAWAITAFVLTGWYYTWNLWPF